jgi:hypothetical protein
MTLKVKEAEVILKSRFVEPVKTPTKKIVGYATPKGRLLALHRELRDTRIWFQRPAPPPLDGVELLADSNDGNSNPDSGPLKPLYRSGSLRVRILNSAGLHNFLDWYTA